MTKEGMNHTYTDAEIDAAILRGAEVVGEEVRKGLGLPLESVADPVAVSAAEEAAPVKPAAVEAASKAKPAVAESVPKTGKPGVGKKARRHFKGDKSTVVTSATGAGRHKGGRVGNKAAKKVSEKIAAETGADKVVEGKKAEEASVAAGFPEGGVSRDSVYESRMSVPYPIEDIERQLAGIQLQTNEDGAPGAVETNDGIPVLTDVVKETDVLVDPAMLTAQADEAARARLEQIQEEEGSIERPVVSEALLVEEAVPDAETGSEADKFKELRREVAKARAKYASRMYEHNRLTERLRQSPIGRFLRKGIGEADSDMPDLEYWRLDYEEKLAALREAELEEIKESDLKGQALKEAMAGLLRASKVDEVLSLISDRDTYRLEGNELSDKAYNAFRSISEKYNKLPLKYKVMAGAAVGLLALSTAVYGGAALSAGAMAVRKFVSGAGFSVAIDATLDAKTKERFKKQAEEEIMAELEQMFDPVGPFPEGVMPSEHPEEGMMQAFEERLQAASGGVTLAFEDQLFKRKLNGIAGAVLGTIAGSAGSAAAEWFKESGAADATHDIIFGQEAVPVEPTDIDLALRASAAREMAESYGSASPVEQMNIRDTTGMTDEQLKALAKTVRIQGGDFAPEAAPVAAESNLPQVEIDYEQELERVRAEAMEGKETEEILEIDTSKWSNVDGSAVHDRTGLVSPQEAVPNIQPETGLAPELQPRVDGWFDQIFRVDGEMPGSGRDWVLDREKLANTKISDMIRDAVLYQKGEVSGFRTNLSAEQLKNFAQFFQNAGTGIGDQKAMAGIIYDTMRNKDMTVMDYLEKVAPIAKRGQRFGLFTTSV